MTRHIECWTNYKNPIAILEAEHAKSEKGLFKRISGFLLRNHCNVRNRFMWSTFRFVDWVIRWVINRR